MPRAMKTAIARIGACVAACPALLAAMLAPGTAVAAQPHAHGIATLEIAVEARGISLRFDSPLDNLLGFERAPRNDAERKRADAAVVRLRAGGEMFAVDPAAQCRLSGVELSSAALRLGDAKAAQSDHADLEAVYSFECADAAKAAHIDTGLFEFARLQRLRVQVVTPKAQLERELKRPARRIVLSR
jgi:Protein of unknown function (DUF2796)